MNRLREEYQPEDCEVDPYDDTLDATERRAAHAAHKAEIAAIDAAERYADRNVFDDDILQPDITFKKTNGGSRSRRRRPRPRGAVGRPIIGNEARSILGSVRMTPTTAALLRHISENHGGKNLTGSLEMVASLILAGNAEVLLSLRASFAQDGDTEGRSAV
jgi:hypothetical protein